MSTAATERREYRGFGYYSNTGVGDESGRLSRFLGWQLMEALSATVLLSPKLAALNALKRVYQDCRLTGWDGEGAAPISVEAYLEAQRFILLLPSLIEMPEILPSPNGQIGLEWYVEKNRLLVVAIAGRGSLTYAFLNGTPTAQSDVLKFTDAIPVEVSEFLSKLKLLPR